MRNGLSRAAVEIPQSILPEFTKLEQALIEKLENIQNNLDDALNEISANDRIVISSFKRDEIRRIFSDTQRALGAIARNQMNSTALSTMYRNVNKFVQMVDEMEVTFCQTLRKCASKRKDADESDSLVGKTARELFVEFSNSNEANLLADHSDMIRQIERVGNLAGTIHDQTVSLLDNRSEHPIFLERFFDARRMVSEAIEKIHRVIHRHDKQSSQIVAEADAAAQGLRRRGRAITPASEDERCYDFGLISLCSKMKRQVRALLVKNNKAQEKRIEILKMICSLAGRNPESSSDRDSTSSYTSSESSESRSSSDSSSDDSSRSSSPASSGLFSRSRSPDPKNPNQLSARPRQ